MARPAPLHGPGVEVARLRLPMAASALAAVVAGLERAYGRGLRLKPEGQHYSITTPNADELAADEEYRRKRRAAKRAAAEDASFSLDPIYPPSTRPST